MEIDARIPSVNSSTGVYLAARVDNNGCTTLLAQGIFFFMMHDSLVISADLSKFPKKYNLNSKKNFFQFLLSLFPVKCNCCVLFYLRHYKLQILHSFK